MPDTLHRVIRIDMTEEEMLYVMCSLNLADSTIPSNIGQQIQAMIILHEFLCDMSEPGRMERLNDFKERIARLFAGNEKVDLVIKAARNLNSRGKNTL